MKISAILCFAVWVVCVAIGKVVLVRFVVVKHITIAGEEAQITLSASKLDSVRLDTLLDTVVLYKF